MHTDIKILFLILLLAASLPAAAHDGHGEAAGTAFASILHHYEAMWRALAADSSDHVVEHAEGMLEAADLIVKDFSAGAAGLEAGADTEAAMELFGKIAEAALHLSSAADLATAREAFYEISKPMVRLNELLAGEQLNVVYCSMAKKSWLQRDEQVVNPYYGRSMSGCGEVVSR